MKTAEELIAIAHIKVGEDFDNGKRVGLADTLKYAIMEHDNEIKAMIDEMLGEEKVIHDFNEGKRIALTELRGKL